MIDGLARRRFSRYIGLALLAYLPALLSAPGRVPGDTKLSLYLDPGRLIADSIWTWDSRQFSGWVPHQAVGYLWPSGPFYALFDALTIPDWLAHRLWIGTLLFLAGAGVVRLGRVLGLGTTTTMVAAVSYQLSPYVLPYVSRTSALLLPWSLLGWIVASAVLVARRRRWRDVAIWTLLVASTGGLNATALVMVAPAPLVFVLAENRWRQWRHSAITLAILGGSAAVASAWWVAGLVTQGRFGAAVLSYSEALPSTAATSTSLEVLRGLGYWLFYDRNIAVPLTTAADPYMSNWLVIVAGLTLTAIGIFGIRSLPGSVRRPAAALFVFGTILAVGAHPFADPSPLWRLAVDNPTSALSLALRSSSRAAPLVVLAIALGAGALSELLRQRVDARSTSHRRGAMIPIAVCALAVVNLPSLLTGRLVDPIVDRPETVPSAWSDAGRLLDQRLRLGFDGAVLVLPGVESSAYRWGYPVDPILPSLTDKRVVSRDWLPLGSAPYMDALYALDDAAQESRLDPDAIAPMARLLGADTVMIVNSVEYERFGTVRPERFLRELGDSPNGLTRLADFGSPSTNVADRFWSNDRILAPTLSLPEISLWAVDDPSSPARSSQSPTWIRGGGTGLLDAASAGLVDGYNVVLDVATFNSSTEAFLRPFGVIVTDGARRRAHHWRSSQEVWGATEPSTGVISTVDVFDQRLVDTTGTPGEVTIRPETVEAVATAYGTDLSYWPEYRPSMALDGDLSTAWRVGDDRDPRGEVLTIMSVDPLSTLHLVRTDDSERLVSAVDVRVDRGAWVRHEIADDTMIVLADAGRTIDVRIADVSTRGMTSTTEGAPIGFFEVLPEQLRRPEVVDIAPLGSESIDAFVFTRLTADPIDHWRDDPERRLVRSFVTPSELTASLSLEARLSTRSSNEVIARLLDIERTSSEHLEGNLAWSSWSAVDGDTTTSWWSPLEDQQPTFVVEVPHATDTLTIVQPPDSPRIFRVEVAHVGGRTESVDVDSEGTFRFDPTRDPSGANNLLEITVVDYERLESTDRRTGHPIRQPVGVAEIVGATPIRLDGAWSSPCRDDLVELDGRALSIRLGGRVDRLLDGGRVDIESCDDAFVLAVGPHRLETTSELETGLAIDRVVLRSTTSNQAVSADPVDVTTSRASRTFTTLRCPSACVIEGFDGWNVGWSGDPLPSASGRNVWVLSPSDSESVFTTRWTPQRLLWLGLGLTGITVLVALLVLVFTRRDTEVDPPRSGFESHSSGAPFQRNLLLVVGSALVIAVSVAPLWGALPLAVGAAAIVIPSMRHHVDRVLLATGFALVALGLFFVVAQQLRTGAEPSFGWPSVFSRAHRPTLAGVVMWGLGLSFGRDSLRRS